MSTTILPAAVGKDLPEKWCVILPTYVEHSFFKHLAAFILPCCVRVRSVFRSIFITDPSEPPPTHQRHLHAVWCLSSFSTGSHRRGKPGEQKRCLEKKKITTAASPRLFASPQSRQRFPTARFARAPPQLSEQRLDVVTDRQRTQTGRAMRLCSDTVWLVCDVFFLGVVRQLLKKNKNLNDRVSFRYCCSCQAEQRIMRLIKLTDYPSCYNRKRILLLQHQLRSDLPGHKNV